MSKLATEPQDRVLTEPVSGSADWVFARVPRSRRDVVLDVAAGTGLGGRSLAADVRQVIALDLRPAVLELGRREAAAAGVENILFMRGDAASLPFLDDTFRVVLCRFALHRFPEPSVQLSEIKRVLEARGWLGLADMVVSEDHAIAERQNRIERLADLSHVRALSASELQDTVARLGYEVAGAETHDVRRPLDAWLESSQAPAPAAAKIRNLLRSDAEGGEPTGLAPQVEPDGSLSFVHTFTSLLVLNRDA